MFYEYIIYNTINFTGSEASKLSWTKCLLDRRIKGTTNIKNWCKYNVSILKGYNYLLTFSKKFL